MLSVKDIMRTDVVTTSPDTSARQLAKLLADEEITGVPVLDLNDELVGVVSSTDLVRLAADESGVEVRSRGLRLGVDPALDPDLDPDDAAVQDPYGFFLPEDSPFTGARVLEQWPDSEFDSVLVRDIMTPVSFSVQPDTPVPELCEFLVRGRIHRAVVVDDSGLVGIVTSADVLKAVAEQRVAV
jgi:CBS domain-containing protein